MSTYIKLYVIIELQAPDHLIAYLYRLCYRKSQNLYR